MEWMNAGKDRFSIEMSEFEEYLIENRRMPDCPKCGKLLIKTNLMIGFPFGLFKCERRHRCGAKLVFFNDPL